MAELGFGESLKFQLEKRLEPWHRIFEPLVPQATVRGYPAGESPPHGAATGRRVPTGVAAGSRLRFPTGLHRPRSLAAAPCCFGPIALEGGTICSEQIVDIDQSRARDDLARQRFRDDSCVAVLHVWAGRHRKGAAVADDATRVTMNYAPARSAKRAIREMRPCAAEVPSQ
jgi:hypothetical protein